MRTLIAILGGSIIKSQGTWSTREHTTRLRVAAGARLFKTRVGYQDKLGDKTFVLSLGGKAKGEKPSNSYVMNAELVQLGVPVHMILPHKGEQKNTYQELGSLQDLIQEASINLLLIVSNETHLPRVAAMIKHAPNLDLLMSCELQLISAEEYLLGYDAAKWKGLIEEARAQPWMSEKLQIERQGTLHVEAGTYTYR